MPTTTNQLAFMLGQLGRRVSGELQFELNLSTSLAITTITGTAGYLIWSLRGGFLMATLASSLPTWSHFDPLPVLENGSVATTTKGIRLEKSDKMFE